MRVTIKSIARDLDISHMTVSRALSGSPNVRPETRATILARATELGYVRSSAANAMRGHPTAIVGLLLPNIINEFYARFANALGILCADRGLDLVIHLTSDDPDRERQSLQRLQALQAAAVILVPTSGPPDAIGKFAASMRVIELIRTRGAPDVWGRLLIEDGPAIQAAVAHLAITGRRRIAFIGADPAMSSGRDRVAAFESALRAQGQVPEAGLIRTGAPGFAMGQATMHALLERDRPPDAVICGGFEISNGALDSCLRAGVSFPDDLAFVGYGDPVGYRWISQGISTIDVSADDLAKRAIGLLSAPNPAPPDASASSPTRFVPRASAGG